MSRSLNRNQLPEYLLYVFYAVIHALAAPSYLIGKAWTRSQDGCAGTSGLWLQVTMEIRFRICHSPWRGLDRVVKGGDMMSSVRGIDGSGLKLKDEGQRMSDLIPSRSSRLTTVTTVSPSHRKCKGSMRLSTKSKSLHSTGCGLPVGSYTPQDTNERTIRIDSRD